MKNTKKKYKKSIARKKSMFLWKKKYQAKKKYNTFLKV